MAGRDRNGAARRGWHGGLAGLTGGRGRGRRGYWCNVNQRLIVHRFRWCFLMCIQSYFAPLRTLHRWRRCPGCWRRGGWRGARRGGWQGDTPPSTGREGTIDGFSLQKFFFGFRVALSGVGRPNLLTYIIECVQINKEWDGKLFVFCCEVGGFSGFGGVGG